MTIATPQSAAATAASTSSRRADAVGRVCSLLRDRPDDVDAALLCDFAALFLARVPQQLFTERTPDGVAAMVRGAFRFLERARPGQVNAEVVDPAAEGWRAPVTTIRVELGDRPFIVDSVREYLDGIHVPIGQYLYPAMQVERDAEGRVVRVGDVEAGRPLEALLHIEVPQIESAERRSELLDGLRRRLSDVVAATDDWPAMLGMLHAAGDRLRAAEGPDAAEATEFLRWLEDGNFVFLGAREVGRAGSELGILRSGEGPDADAVPAAALPTLAGWVQLEKSRIESTVHRRAPLDVVRVAGAAGEGELRFWGLLTSQAYDAAAEDVPIVRAKARELLGRSGALPGQHDYKEIRTLLGSMPLVELFSTSPEELEREVEATLQQLYSDEIRVLLRQGTGRRTLTAVVVLPTERFRADVRGRIEAWLLERFGGTPLYHFLALGTGPQSRIYFHLAETERPADDADARELERVVGRLVRSWQDALREELEGSYEAAAATVLAARYGGAFPEGYRVATPPADALRDLEQLERLRVGDAPIAVELRARPGSSEAGEGAASATLRLYLRGERLVLSDFLPTLENAGLRVLDVTPYAVAAPELPPLTIYSFTVGTPGGTPVELDRADLLAETLLAVRAGQAANDVLNALTLRTGLRWREVDVLRAYAEYAFQIGAAPTRGAITYALVRVPEMSRVLIDLFGARHDPDRTHEDGAAEAARERAAAVLDSVTSLADDRALRRLLAVVEATVRTNYFRGGAAEPTRPSGGAPYISFKIRSSDLDELRRTRLLYEVWVHSARMAGIHLRGAPVSRGGIRWSDRPDDFRTEIMGLVQTQVVKNAVIVPSGSKGGFVTRQRPADRDALMEEAKQQYQTLMRGLLDLTDNLVDGRIVPPPHVVRHDGDDPYLVVAADKGTAHLSDTANAVAAEYGFWLGDAFASGGSYGYDHKVVGITAKGGWECVRRHFRELGKDIQTEPFTVAGIGDMSGDVFGNGMLLSRQIRLLAAFDHRHIFLDPNPDPETSFRERERIFALPRSSWDDYDRGVLSPGAMIIPRASKEIQITPEVRAALAIEDDDGRMDGEALIRAVLRAPVELLWNGGIGTYFKDARETHADAGDPSNDSVRIDADTLRCKVVGEGGNLGFTQRARVTYALAGGRINTDALDNSAGVDMSDHEVNLKILLAPEVVAGRMTPDARNTLLEGMTPEVTRLVLQDNIDQSLAVSLDEVRSRESLHDFVSLLTGLEREGLLRRGAEGLPSTDTMQERAGTGEGLSRPTLCVLLAYAKLSAKAQVLASPLPDDPATAGYLAGYFPDQAVAAVGVDRLAEHRLRREIVTTTLVNDLVALMGASFLHRAAAQSGHGVAAVARAWLVASRVAGAGEIRGMLETLEGQQPSATVYRWVLSLARVLERTTQWVLANTPADAPTAALTDDLVARLEPLRAGFGGVVAGPDRELWEARTAELRGLGADNAVAERMITLRFLPQMLDILQTSSIAGGDVVGAARTYYAVSDRFGLGLLAGGLAAVPAGNRWDTRHAHQLADGIAAAQRALGARVLACTLAGQDTDACLADVERAHPEETRALRELLAEIGGGERLPLSAFAVAARMLEKLAS